MADTTLDILFQLNSEVKGISDAIKKTNELNKAQASFGKRLTEISNKSRQVGKALTAGVTLPLAAAAIGATQVASDLNETLSKTDAIFKDSSEAIKKWAKSADKNFGLSQRAALDAASQFGGALKEIGGLDEGEASRLSQQFVGLSSDLNSFFNRDDAQLAIGSALTGEFEPLKKFNVIINDAILKQKALELGLFSGTGALDAQAKQAATTALILEKTGDAQGDFARTSDGLANQQRILKAEFENAAAGLGQQFLPVALKLVNWAREALSQFAQLSPQLQKLVVIGAGIAAATGPVLLVLGSLWPILVAVAGVLTGPVALAVAGFVAATGLIITNWSEVKAFITNFVQGVITEFTNWRDRNSENLASIGASLNSIKTSFLVFGDVIVVFARQGIEALNSFLAPIGGLQGAWGVLKEVVRNVVDGIAGFITVWLDQVSTTFEVITENIDTSKSIWENLGQVIGTVVASIIDFVVNMASQMRDALVGINWGQLGRDMMNGLKNGIVAAGQGAIQAVKDVGKGAVAGFKNFLEIRSPSRLFMEMGGFITDGLALGVKNGSSSFLTELKDTGERAVAQTQSIFEQIAFANETTGISSDVQNIASSFVSDEAKIRNDFSTARQTILAEEGLTQDQKNQLILAKEEELQILLSEARAFNGETNFLENFALSVPSVDESLNELATGSLQDVTDGVSELIQGTTTWGELFQKVGSQIVSSLIKIGVQRTAMFLLGQTQQATATASQVTSGATIAAANAPAAAATSTATFGASAVIGSIAAIAAIAAVIAAISGAFVTGGTVPGGISQTDNRLILAASGERIIPNGPSQEFGGLLDGIIAGRNPVDLIDIEQEQPSFLGQGVTDLSSDFESQPAEQLQSPQELNILFSEQQLMDRIEAAVDGRLVDALRSNNTEFFG